MFKESFIDYMIHFQDYKRDEKGQFPSRSVQAPPKKKPRMSCSFEPTF